MTLAELLNLVMEPLTKDPAALLGEPPEVSFDVDGDFASFKHATLTDGHLTIVLERGESRCS